MRTKATLRIEVEYDPDVTDVEGVCEGLDVLLATAMSTSGVLDDCGPVEVGTFTAEANGMGS